MVASANVRFGDIAMSTFLIRRAVPEGIAPAYAMFRRSLFVYLHRMGVVGAEAAQSSPIAEAWLRQACWIEHLGARPRRTGLN